MKIAIWGRDGTGKSTLSDALGQMFAKHGVTAIIDTDLTQPTLPIRVNGQKLRSDSSLGTAISGIGVDDAPRYLHQHPRNKHLFYAGLTDHDEYLSFELGLDASDAARGFVERCEVFADTIILDLSGQRTDPFLPVALSSSDKLIISITPDVQGVCWFNAAKPFFEAMNVSERIVPVAAMAIHPSMKAIEKAADIRFFTVLPFVREFRQSGVEAVSTPTAIRYMHEVRNLHALLKGVDAK